MNTLRSFAKTFQTAFPHPAQSGLALLLYGVIAAGLIWGKGSDSKEISRDSFLYLLSSQAQVLAAVLALVFSATLIVAQMSGRYSRRLADPILSWWLLWYLTPFFFGAVIPLFLLNGNFYVTGLRLSLMLGGACLVLLIPYLDAMRAALNTADLLSKRRSLLASSLGQGQAEDFHALIDAMAGAARNNDIGVARMVIEILHDAGIAKATKKGIARSEITSLVSGASASLANYPSLLVAAEDLVYETAKAGLTNAGGCVEDEGHQTAPVWDLFSIHSTLNRLSFGHDATAYCLRMLDIANASEIEGATKVRDQAILAASESVLVLRETVALSSAMRVTDDIAGIAAGLVGSRSDLAPTALGCLFGIYGNRDSDPVLGAYVAGNIRACCESLASNMEEDLYLVAVAGVARATRRTERGWRSSEGNLADEMFQVLFGGLNLWKRGRVWFEVRPVLGNIVEIVALNPNMESNPASRLRSHLTAIPLDLLPPDMKAQEDISGWLNVIREVPSNSA